MKIHTCTRRGVLRSAGVGAAALFGRAGFALQAEQEWGGLKIGVASYTFRKKSVPEIISAMKRLGLKYVSIKEMHLPLKSTADQRKEVASQFRAAGIIPASCGVVYLKNEPTELRNAFEYARDAGMSTIVCAPDLPALPALNDLVKEFDIRLAIHNHGPGDNRYPTPADVMRAVERLDPRIGVCIDIGHTLRAGADPAVAVKSCRDRLYDLHIKDVTKATAQGSNVEGGRGVLDLGAVFDALLEIRYAHVASFEYEKDADDPLPGLAESVGYCHGLVRRSKFRR